jgi:acyl-CoA thioester hydrolase
VGADAFHWSVDVRFRDIDALGHAHHSLLLVYIEEARAAWWRELSGSSDLAAIEYVLGEVRVRFLRRVLYPQRLDVALRVIRIGTSSFDLDYEVRGSDGVLLATAATSQVMFDRETEKSKPIPDTLRRRMAPAR